MEPEKTKIGKYEILSVLGKGAMGTIYKGIDPVIQRHVAIKTISSHIPSAEQSALKERFIREAQAAGRLQHINIVSIFEYGEDADQAFIAMEFVEGVTLTDKLHARVQFTIPEICSIMIKVLNALEYAHSMGVVHRDIKPGNIILTESGEVKVTDFGIARLESSTMTQIGTVLGTPGYMSPEQLVGENVDNRSDIFSAGAMLYELLTGEKAYSGTTFTSVMYKILNTDPIPPASICPTVPEAFDEIIRKALEKKPENRYQSAAAFAAAIAAVAEARSGVRDVDHAAATLHDVPRAAPTPAVAKPQPAPEGDRTRYLQESADTTRIMHPKTSRGGRRALYTAAAVLISGIAVVAGWPLLQEIIGQRQSPVAVPEPAPGVVESGTPKRDPDARVADTTTGSVQRDTGQSAAGRYTPGQQLKECDACPALVVIPPGSYMQGSPESEADRQPNEGPQHLTRIDYTLAVGRYEVTRGEYRQFAAESGHSSQGCSIYQDKWVESEDSGWQNPGYEQTDTHPATCISWNDATAYVKWLSDKTHHHYRLLSSSEWEYIAKAGSAAIGQWGGDAGQACQFANIADTSAEKRYNGWTVHGCNDGFVYTAPAGSFKPNGFSVYDMLGNVFEWVEDCWKDDYQGVPADGAPWTAAGCSERGLRGGSW
ncbi:MAG TPA: bifunctional serine/threonine-protein kinase/formylglycine-generating enzyme family protein, partial [Gammaproteobacteria bacterium]|nr:bifunctional serine/threonine-protein kinase/formylglycine-generating enzyme family protein [Gammaproteobacteria bacterium]